MSTTQRCLRAYAISQRALCARRFSTSPRSLLRVENEITDADFTGKSPKPSTTQPTTSTHTSLSEQPDAAALKSFAADLRSRQTKDASSTPSSLARAATEPYVAYGATQTLFGICAKAGSYSMPPLGANEAKAVTPKGEEIGLPAEDSDWYRVTGLTPTFNTWAQITFLHMWVLTVRLRAFEAGHARYWHQNLIDHFFYAAEDRMATLHGVATGGVRNRYLKDLHLQWRGCIAAYDEGFASGDAVLGAALWRNLFGASENVDAEKLAAVVEWSRKALSEIDGLRDDELAGGVVRFPGLKELHGQSEDSPSMSEPLDA